MVRDADESLGLRETNLVTVSCAFKVIWRSLEAVDETRGNSEEMGPRMGQSFNVNSTPGLLIAPPTLKLKLEVVGKKSAKAPKLKVVGGLGSLAPIAEGAEKGRVPGEGRKDKAPQ